MFSLRYKIIAVMENKNKLTKTEEEWKKELSPEEYRVIREKGTEKPFSGKYVDTDKKGVYKCKACGQELFSSKDKFHSESGWPSFSKSISEGKIEFRPDESLGMKRIEIVCSRCNAHLGHVFDDGPKSTGKRFCVNSVSLNLDKENKDKDLETATFAAGCFWGIEDAFLKVKGVKSTVVGYTGGNFKNPIYEDVCSSKTGHAEAVQISFDPKIVSYEELLGIFWSIHDPTTPNRQGPDIGSQYRSAIFFHNKEQEKSALKSKQELEKSGRFENKIVTQILAAAEFYKAEEYHQKYVQKTGKKVC